MTGKIISTHGGRVVSKGDKVVHATFPGGSFTVCDRHVWPMTRWTRVVSSRLITCLACLAKGA